MVNDNNEYLKQVLDKYKIKASNINQIMEELKKLIGPWTGGYCEDFVLGGSFGQGTAIKKQLDLDIDTMLYMRSDTPYSPEEMYNSLATFLRKKGHKVEKRNISLRITYKNMAVDFVVGKKIPGHKDFYYVWSRRENKELQTNIQLHKDLIKESGLKDSIKLIKIWVHNHNLNFDGFHSVLTVLDVLKDEDPEDLYNNLIKVLKFLATKWIYRSYRDPSRSQDKVDQNTDPKDKEKIVRKAKECLAKNYLNDIIW